MPRVPVEYRTTQKDVFKRFKLKYPEVNIDYNTWCSIIYNFNYAFRDYILETGHKIKFPYGFGDFTITKYKPRKEKELPDGKKVIGLPINWKRSKELGQIVYHMNYNTEGFKFKWRWDKTKARFSNSALWCFKPSRVTSRLLNHYLSQPDYQYKYQEWN